MYKKKKHTDELSAFFFWEASQKNKAFQKEN